MHNISYRLRMMMLSAMFAAITAVGAFIALPLQMQVPVTFQTFGTLCSGALLGPFWGPVSQILYICIGVCGLPVFAKGQSGIGTLFGPTGGYLVGFVVCSFMVGLIFKKESRIRLAAGIITGTISIYVCGILWLSMSLGISVSKALFAGMIPFLPGDAVKAFIAFMLCIALKQRVLKNYETENSYYR